MASQFTLYFCSDLHGSERCYRKFLNAGKFYGAQALVLGGDLTGKAIVALERRSDGRYTCEFMGRSEVLEPGSEVEAFEKRIRDTGLYPYRAEPGEMENAVEKGELDALFVRLMVSSLGQWLDLAEKRLKGTGIRCFVMPGNDDPDEISRLLDQSTAVINLDERVDALDDEHFIAGLGYSNETPWHTHRELTEEDIAAKLGALMDQIRDPRKAVLVTHVPPYASGLDEAPVLDENLTVQATMGQVKFAPVGSRAVRTVIERYQPLLSLHGHIHESHATARIGQTLSANPGSDYGEGVVHGFLCTIRGGVVSRHQLVTG